MKYRSLFFVLMAVWAWSCIGDKKTERKTDISKSTSFVPLFNEDSAYGFVQRQLAFGPRVPNTRPHNDAGDYLVRKLRAYNWKVTVQNFESPTFDGQYLYLRNIIGSYNLGSRKRILLAAHWDTRPFADKDAERPEEPIAGANDGASGVAVLLEMARVMAQYDSLKVGIDIIFFDGEDWGNDVKNHGEPPLKNGLEAWWCLGSQYWSKNKHQSNYSAYYGILLDMVGGENAQFYQEGYSMKYAPSIVDKVWKTGQKLGYSRFFVNKAGGAITDDHYFVNKNAKIPMIDIIPTDPVNGSFGSFHHTHKDNLSIISKETLKAVGQTLLQVMYNEE